MSEQIEGLEYHAHPAAQCRDVSRRRQNVLTIDEDASASRSIQQIKATQKRAFAGTRGSDDGNYLADSNLGIDVLEDIDCTKLLG